MSSRTSYIVQIIFSFWSFEISESILINKKNRYRFRFILSPTFYIFGSVWIILVFVSTILLQNYSISLWFHFAKSTGSLLTALKGYQFYFHLLLLSWGCAVWRPLNVSPYIAHSADYIFLLVIRDQRGNSEKSNIRYRLRFIF